MKIAVDAMGGDRGSLEIVKGVVAAVSEYNSKIALVGKERMLKEMLDNFKSAIDLTRIEILNADEEITMTDTPLAALRHKKKSSITIGINSVKTGDTDCFISTGNTGAVMAAATIKLGLIEGIERPGIATALPNSKKSATILMDVGANVDCSPIHLLHYGIMGAEYAKVILNKSEVSLGLLNIGEEDTKGNDLAKASFELLKRHLDNFYGNVEGRDIFKCKTDVVVCDGFVGNTILKVSEGLAETLFGLIREGINQKFLYKAGAFFLKPFFKEFKKTIDYSEYGGAPLLGVNGYCIICHGRSSSNAIKNAVRVAENIGNKKINEKICERINKIPSLKKEEE